jgi:hypothetical protein
MADPSRGQCVQGERRGPGASWTVPHPGGADHRIRPFRKTTMVLEGVVAVGGLAGTAQLWSGRYAPPVSVLSPLGLTGWRLPALWLCATVVVPSAAAAWLAWRSSPHAPAVVVLASVSLATELIVQIPFLGLNVMQAVFGSLAALLAVLAVHARRLGWRPGTAGDVEVKDRAERSSR